MSSLPICRCPGDPVAERWYMLRSTLHFGDDMSKIPKLIALASFLSLACAASLSGCTFYTACPAGNGNGRATAGTNSGGSSGNNGGSGSGGRASVILADEPPPGAWANVTPEL